MHSWIARLLLLAMLGPSFGQLAMARAAQPEAMHCMRKPVQPTMQCHHHGMAMAPLRQSSEASFQAVTQCCQNHDCCCRVAVRQWAQPQSRPLSLCALPIERVSASLSVVLASAGVAGYNSARAPPRS
jgi:hypothetical protein